MTKLKGALAAVLVFSGCGAEGLTVHLSSPLAVGTHAVALIDRCLNRGLVGPGRDIYPCVDFDSLTAVSVVGDGSSAFTIGEVHAGWVRIDALAAGTTRLSVSATSQRGEQLTATFDLEARQPAAHTLTCLYGDHLGCTPQLAWVQGREQRIEDLPLFDEGRAMLSGTIDYQASGSLSYDGGSNPFVVTATGVGEGRLEPVSPALQAVTTPVVVQVVPASDVAALRLATALYGDAGELLPLPPAVLPQVLVRDALADGGVGVFHAEVYPLLELNDGGWARPQVEEVRQFKADGTSFPLSCVGEDCGLWFERAGPITLGWQGPGRQVSSTFEVQ